jgi:hypothetical protein
VLAPPARPTTGVTATIQRYRLAFGFLAVAVLVTVAVRWFRVARRAARRVARRLRPTRLSANSRASSSWRY